MRSTTTLATALALLGATGCSSISTTKATTRPAPAAHRVSTGASVAHIPPGHYPGPGSCRIWLPGEAPGHQPKPRSCAGIERAAPAGSWILLRPAGDKRKVVHVRVIDERRSGVVVRRGLYDAKRGTVVREG
jgi:hypothetical protein